MLKFAIGFSKCLILSAVATSSDGAMPGTSVSKAHSIPTLSSIMNVLEEIHMFEKC